MKYVQKTIINAAANTTANFSAIDSSQFYAASFMAIFSDAAAAGTIKVQASNDPTSYPSNSGFLPTNWVDIPSATATIASGASALIPMPLNFSYRWLRIVWTRSGGAGTFSVNMCAQET